MDSLFENLKDDISTRGCNDYDDKAINGFTQGSVDREKFLNYIFGYWCEQRAYLG